MLAASDIPDEYQLRNLLDNGPLLATPKWDGIRVLTGEGHVVSRSLKPIRNHYVRDTISTLSRGLGLDGEAVCLDNKGKLLAFNPTQSAIMSLSGRPAFRYFVFDAWQIQDDYQGRVGYLYRMLTANGPFHEIVLPEWVFDYESLMRLNALHLSQGYEGTCVRPRTSPYKHGRSTMFQGWLLKLKPFVDEEATVVGYTNLEVNENPQETNALGLQERSSRMEGKRLDMSRLGALLCYNEKWGEFYVGTGFTDLQRCNPDQYVGHIITFKYQANHSKDKPHAATFKCVRDADDLPIDE